MGKKGKKGLIVLLVTVALIGGGGYLWYRANTGPSKYDEVAQCLTDKGTKMFGAYWCSHCNNQKNMFGNAFKYVEYVECSLPNQAGQNKKCNQEGIESYPTWEFGDGERRLGEISIEELAEKAGCEDKLPS